MKRTGKKAIIFTAVAVLIYLFFGFVFNRRLESEAVWFLAKLSLIIWSIVLFISAISVAMNRMLTSPIDKKNKFSNEIEERVAGKFVSCEGDYIGMNMMLKWNNGARIIARYDSALRDKTDYEAIGEDYLGIWVFVFKAVQRSGELPVSVGDDDYFLISYHNFPDEILVDGKKVN